LVALRQHLLHLAGRRGARVLTHLLPHLRALGRHPLRVLRGRWLLGKTAQSESKYQGECGRTYHGQVVRISHHLALLISSSVVSSAPSSGEGYATRS
jgi:hypothetical protein